MSITDEIKARVAKHINKRLFHLPPTFKGTKPVRELFVSEEIWNSVHPPWPAHRTGVRHAKFRATLDNFTQGQPITVAEDPFLKPGFADMARTAPVEKEIWDFRCLLPDQGIRCFGSFGGQNLFIGLTWDYRENIDDFDSEVERCAAEWTALFDSIPPFEGDILDDYLTRFVAM